MSESKYTRQLCYESCVNMQAHSFWMASALCGMNLISSRTSWKSWSWWWEVRCYRWPACKTASCSRVSHWPPQAQVWALGSLQTLINTDKSSGPWWAGSHRGKVGCQQSGLIKCVNWNQSVVPKSRARNIFITLFYFYKSYEFELASGIIIIITF